MQVWEGTRYEAGACAVGVGVDCVRLIDAVVCAWTGRALPPLVTPAGSQWLHDRNAAAAIGALLRRRHPVYRPSRLTFAAPGDVVVLGRAGAPGIHLCIVDSRGRWWHADDCGVCHTTFPALAAGPVGWAVRRIYSCA